MASELTFEDQYTPRILVVDDEPRIRDACKLVLTEKNYEVDTARDGESGLEMIRDRHFDIILVDLMLPGISGFDVVSHVNDLHPDTVIIVITGYATIEHSIEAMKKGAFDFIPKPFTPDQLRVVVSKAIRHTRALRDIAEARSRLRVMVNRITDGVLTTDNQKRIVLANPAFVQMVGFQGSGVIGKNVKELHINEELIRLIDEVLAMAPGTYAEVTGEMTFNKGKERIISAGCVPFRSRAGETLGSVTVLRDITALKKIDRMKSDFVSMVSHEIRGPMNSLLMQLKVISDGLAGDVTDKQREILDRASGKLNSLINLVSELLDLARIESGLITQEKQEMDMAGLLREQVEFHSAAAAEKKISLTLSPLPRLPLVVANRQAMEEVVSNLICNALKYSPENSRITLSAREENGYFRLDVEDTGFGIDEEDLENIFTRFYRVKNDKTRKIHGTGLGLPIVKSIVEAHQGGIRVQSAPGKGSTFTVHIPLARDEV